MAASSEIDRHYLEGLAALRAGDMATGKEHLLKVVEQEQLHERAWYWLSTCVDTDEERLVCLQNVLVINPHNEVARRNLSKLAAPSTGDKVEPPPSQAEPSSLPISEQWHSSAIDKLVGTGEYVSEAILIPSREPAPRTLFDLTDAWANALIFKIAGSYDKEVRYGSAPHILVNTGGAAIFQVLTALIVIVMLIVAGRDPRLPIAPTIRGLHEILTAMWEFQNARLISPLFRPAFGYLVAATGNGPLPQMSIEIAASLGLIFASCLVLTVLFTFVGQMIQAFVINLVAKWMGGRGEIVELTLALTIGLVATSIAQIPVWMILPFSPAIFVRGLVVVIVYQFLQMSYAVKAAHKLNILTSMGVVGLACFLMGLFGGCFCCLLGYV